MNGFLTVARRELRERSNLVLAAPILALVPLLAPYAPGLTRVPPGEARLAFIVILAFVLPLALALGLGASALGDEVAGRRLGFFFSRPLSAFEIWSGKIVVALVVPVTVSVLILSPLVLRARLGDSQMPWHGFSSLPWFAIIGFSWVVASLAHVAAGLYHTRSPLLVVDLALAGALGGAFYFLGWHLADAGVGLQPGDLGPDSPWIWVATLLFAGVCLAAGFAQVAVGRSDPARGHRALSLTLWGGLGLGLAATATASAWLLSPAPQDLRYRTVVPLPGGYFMLGGVASRGVSVSAIFLVDPRDGRAQRVSSGSSGLVPSASGRHVLFGEGVLSPRLVVVSAVSGQPPVITRALLAKEDEAWPVCLSDDGLLAVIREGSEARVVETATGKRLGLPALEAAAACTFEGRRRLVLYRPDLVRLSTFRRIVDLETGAQGESVEYPGAQGILATHGNRVLGRMRPSGRTEIGLFDETTGRLLANLGPAAWAAEGDPASFLPDGRVAFVDGVGGQDTLRLFDADGHERLAVRVAEKGKAALAGVTPEGEIYVVVRSNETFHTVILDRQTFAPRQRIEGLRPAPGPLTFWNSDPAARLMQSQERLRQGLFLDAKEAIVHLDPPTGTTKLLIAASPGPD
jgi:hypothetical protein